MTYDANLLFADDEKKLTQEPKFDAGLLFDPGKPVAQANLNIASFGKPDDAVYRKNLTDQMRKELGEDWAPNAIDPAEAKRRLMVAENDHVLNTSPALARQYMDTGFAERTFDDVPKLGKVEAAVGGVMGVGKRVGGNVFAGLAADPATAFYTTLALPFKLGEQVLQGVGVPSWMAETEMGKALLWAARASKSTGDVAAGARGDEGNIEAGIYSGIRSLGGNLGMMATGNVLGLGAKATTAAMSGVAGGKSALEAFDAGKSASTATLLGAADATAEYATEYFGVKQLFAIPGMKQGMAAFARGAVNFFNKEMIGEQIATVWQDFNKWAMINPEKSLEEFIAERPDAAIQTAIATIVGGGGQIAIQQTMYRHAVSQNKAIHAEQAGQALAYLNQSIGESATAARDRGTLQQFLQSAAVDEDGNPQTVRINALAFENTLMQAGIDPQQVLAQLPTAQEQWEVAKAAGIDLEIPLSELAGQTFGTDVGNALLPHIAVGEEGMSLVEAQDFAKTQAEEFRKQAEIVMAENDRDGEFVQSAKEVEKLITDQIIATGRYTADIAKTNALPLRDFFVTQAAAMGITPMALYQQFQQKTVAEGQGALNQDGVVIPTSTVKIGKAFTSLINTLGNDDVSELLMNWNDSELSNDGTKIVLFPGRDRRQSAGELGGSVKVGKAEFLSWLHSDAPLDPSVFDVSDEWKAKVEAARNATGLNAVSPAPTFNQGPNKADWDRNSVKASASASKILENTKARGTSTLDIMRDGKVPNIKGTGTKGRVTVWDAANYLAKRAKSKLLGKTPDQVERAMIDGLVAEVAYALSQDGHAVGWYDHKIKAALSKMSEKYPELATDQQARFHFTVITAITSNGQDVIKNFEFADQVYGAWREAKGALPTKVNFGGDRVDGIEKGFASVNQLVAKHGWEKAYEIFLTPMPAGEVKKITGMEVGGEGVDTMVYGAMVLGPKIGSFFANLNGKFDSITMDMWFMRTLGRLDGSLSGIDQALMTKYLGETEALLGDLSNPAEFDNLYGFTKEQIQKDIDKYRKLSPENAADGAYFKKSLPSLYGYIWARYRDYANGVTSYIVDEDGVSKQFKPAGKKSPEKKSFAYRVPANYNAKHIYEMVNNIVEDPGSGGHRNWLRSIVLGAQAKLKKAGIDLSNADFQAVIWYYEKDLFNKLGATNERAEPADYEVAAERIIASWRTGLGLAGRAGSLGQADGSQDSGADRPDVGRPGGAGREVQGQGGILNQAGQAGTKQGINFAEDIKTQEEIAKGLPAVISAAPESPGRRSFIQRASALFARSAIPSLRVLAVANNVSKAVDVVSASAVPAPQRIEMTLATMLRAVQNMAVKLDNFNAYNDFVGDEGYDLGMVEKVESIMSLANIAKIAKVSEKEVGEFFAERFPVTDGGLKSPVDPARSTKYGTHVLAENVLRDIGRGKDDLLLDYDLDWANIEGEIYTLNEDGPAEYFQSLVEELAKSKSPISAYDALKAAQEFLVRRLREGSMFDYRVGLGKFADQFLQDSGIDDAFYELVDQGAIYNNSGTFGNSTPEEILAVMREGGVKISDNFTHGFSQQSEGNANRAGFSPDSLTIILGKGADLSSFLHESAHFYLKVMGDLAARKDAPPRIREQMETTLKWFGIQGTPEVSALDVWNSMTLEEQRPYHEKWAESFEAYLFSGKAPSIELQTAFSRFKSWMLRVYSSYKEFLAGPNGQNADLNPEIAAVFDRLLATDAQIKLAEQARSMMPVFGSEAESGMAVEEWAAYQELAREPTEEAKAALGAKGVKDLTWIRNLTKRMTRKYNREAQDLRDELSIEARREVMSQPIYLAWQFLTGKPLIEDESIKEYRAAVVKHNKQRDAELTSQRKNAEDQLWAESTEGQKKYRKLSTMQKARVSFISAMDDKITEQAEKLMAPWDQANPAPVDPRPAPTVKSGGVDPAVDSLFTAIAKLGGIDTESMRQQWGVDKREKSPQPAFGKRVWHTKGKTLDEMRLALQEYGYLKSQESEDWNPRELEELFHEELAGNPQYSLNADYDQLRGDGQQTAVDPEGQGKFSLDGLRSIGLPGEIINHLKALRMTGKDGFDPDQIAQQFGFSGGEDLARKIAAAPTPKEAVESLVDQRMIENHGELASPKAISEAVDAAIHNEARARLVATELRYLTRAKRGMGDKGPSVRVLMAAAKEFADTLLGRKKLKDINSSVFVSAATKAAQNARQAIIDGDQDVAAAELRNQLLNTTAAKHAIDARDEVQRGVKYLRRFATTKGIKSIDIEYLEQIEQLLERFDLKQRTGKELQRRMGLAAWVAEQEENGLDPVIDQNLIDDARLQHFTDLTLDEFRGLIDAVKSIEHLGRLKKKLLTLKDKRELADVVTDLEESIRDNANRDVKDKNPVTKLDKTKRFFINLGAHHRKFASLIREMDGGKDGGKMWEALVRGMNEAGDKEATLRADMSKKLVEIFKGIKHLNLSTKIYLPEIGTSLRREEVLAIALNSGNAGNVQRLLDGGINNEVRKLSTAQLSAILNRISNEEWDVVEGVWKLIESNRPAIAALEKSLTGVEPKWIEPNPFPLASGRVIAGGYYPAKYNAMFSTRSAELEAITDLRQQTKGAMGNSSTRKGYTEKRSEEVKGRPLKLDLGVIAQHINEVTHRLAWQEWLIDSRRILKSNPVEEAIKDHYGVAVLNEMKDHLQAIAEGDQGAQDVLGKGFAHLRTGATIVGMGYNLMTALTQPIGITNSIERVGAKWIGKGIATFARNPIESTQAVQEASLMMANRAMTMQREINEVLNTVRNQKLSMFQASYFILIQKFQQMVDVPTWLGAYEKAAADPGNIIITNGMVDDSRAVALADQAVLDSQGGGQIKDLSGVQRGSEFKKLMTNFYSFFNVLHQRMAETHRRTKYSDPFSVAKAGADYLLLFILPTVLMMMLKEALRGDDDDQDEETWLKKYAKEQLSFLLGTTIVGRELTSAVAGFRGYQGPAGFRFFVAIGKFFNQAGQVVDGFEFHEEELDMPLLKATLETAGVVLHLPTGQVSRMIEGTNMYLEGAAGPQAAIVGPPIKD